jgi:hypothetical protein
MSLADQFSSSSELDFRHKTAFTRSSCRVSKRLKGYQDYEEVDDARNYPLPSGFSPLPYPARLLRRVAGLVVTALRRSALLLLHDGNKPNPRLVVIEDAGLKLESLLK